MGFITSSITTDLILTLSTLLLVLYKFLSHCNSYWKNRGVPYVKPIPFFGNLADSFLGIRNVNDIIIDIYNQLKGEPFGGYYELISPVLLIKDPELIEKVLVKDFSHFVDRRQFKIDAIKVPLSARLPVLTGNKWRNMRYKLTPTFTTGKLKGMFEQIYNCGEGLLETLRKVSESGKPVEAKVVLSSFATDVIATCGFGLQFKHDSEDGKKFKRMADKFFSSSTFKMISFFLSSYSSKIGKFLGAFASSKDINEYFVGITKGVIDYRQKNNISRNDFVQLLMSLREQEKSGKVINIDQDLKDEDAYLRQEDYKPTNDEDNLELTDEVLAAQAFIFLAAGTETVSLSLSQILFSLATDSEIYKKVKEEVDTVLEKHGAWNYQAVKEMTYLDQVIQESLRFHPFVVGLQRIVTAPYQIPGTKLMLEKGTRINIPVHALHKDPQVYPDPHKFDPERFKDNNHKSSWKYLPFGHGPRVCIGMRFALLEMKLCVARIMSQFSMSLSEKTQNPLQYDESSFFPRPKTGIWLHFHERRLQDVV